MKILRREINAKYRLFNVCLNFKSKIYVTPESVSAREVASREKIDPKGAFQYKIKSNIEPLTQYGISCQANFNTFVDFI